MTRSHRFIEEGDLVLLYMSRDRTPITLTATRGANHVNAYGVFPHDSIIGMPFGSTLKSSNQRGFITLLRPSPELWTQSLPHRTQILYGPDMSFIAMKLALTPGSKVVEAGTGSGSFTHFLARSVARHPCGATTGKGWKGQPGMGISAKGSRGRGGGGRGDSQAFSETAAATPSEQDESMAPSSATSRAVSPAQGAQGNPSSSRQNTPPFRGSPPPVSVHASEQFANERSAKVTLAQSQASATVDDAETSGGSEAGKVWTFEFHAEREKRAREELELHGLCPQIVSLSHRNVCLHGFPSALNGQADAVFLDLPAPWEAIPFLPTVLDTKITTRVCCFSPCIEQVLRTVKALNSCGFRDVETFEVLIRSHESLKDGVTDMPARDIGDLQAHLREVAKKRERVSEGQRRRAQERKALALAKAQEGSAKNGESTMTSVADGASVNGRSGGPADGSTQDGPSSKRPRIDADAEDDEDGLDEGDEAEGEGLATTDPSASTERQLRAAPTAQLAQTGHGNVVVRSNLYSRVHPVMRGHTSYLTFASLLPRSSASAQPQSADVESNGSA
ncbi:unnamed protein product [Parajaminaea phylloscopi]